MLIPILQVVSSLESNTLKSTNPIYWPAEWEPQAATWISWPHNTDTWPGRFDSIPACFKQFIAILSEVQPVHVLSGPNSAVPAAHQLLSGIRNVSIHQQATNDAWIRDYGPTFVRHKEDGQLIGVDWAYNAWGGKYPPFDLDARAAEAVCNWIGCRRSVSTLCCEGGALDTDGAGTLLTSSSCLLNKNRNPTWTQETAEIELCTQLGIEKIVWVDGGGIEGDDTDGHIDQLARFVQPGVVVAATSCVDDDPNHDGLLENVRILRNATGANGSAISVHPLATPPPRFIGSVRVPESYCNFVLANGIVIVPTFRHMPTDRAAIELFEQLFPSRTVIPLDARDVVWGLGAFHCASQQQPTC